jgi:biotin operon repressor
MIKKSGRSAERRKPAGPVQRAAEPRGRAVSARAAGQRTRADQSPATSNGGGRWTFLTNHSHVLIVLAQSPTMVLRQVAARIGITERAVQRIIAELHDAGFIEIEKVGRRNQYRIVARKSLRHPIESHHTIGDLIAMVQSR